MTLEERHAFERRYGFVPKTIARRRRLAPGRAPFEILDVACAELERVAGSSAHDFMTRSDAIPSELLRLVDEIRAARGALLKAAIVACAVEADEMPPELLPRPLAWVRTE